MKEKTPVVKDARTVDEKLNSGYYDNKKKYSPCSKNMDVYTAWNNEEGRRMTEFANDCAAEAGVTGHKNERMLWHKAWDHGHANGLGTVWYYYRDFAELLK